MTGRGSFAMLAAFLGVPGLIYYAEYHASLVLPLSNVYARIERIPGKQQPVSNQGIFTPNDWLHKATMLYEGAIQGSEGIAVAPNGSLYLLDKYGTVFQSHSATSPLQRVTHLGAGRPLGFDFDESGNLFICNTPTGLQVLDNGSKTARLLASEALISPQSGEQRSRIQHANSLAIASNGSIYMTDSTDIPTELGPGGWYDTQTTAVMSFYQVKKSGRILHYNPISGEMSVVVEGLVYPNGIALSADESFLLVVETPAPAISRLWLKGPKAGIYEPFLEIPSFPFFPDGISRGRDGNFWVAFVAKRKPALEKIWPSRLFRWALAWGPACLKPKMGKAGGIMQVSEDGAILRYMADLDGSHFSSVSSVIEAEAGLYFGSLAGDWIGFLPRIAFGPLDL